jgi:hypothetical protein
VYGPVYISGVHFDIVTAEMRQDRVEKHGDRYYAIVIVYEKPGSFKVKDRAFTTVRCGDAQSALETLMRELRWKMADGLCTFSVRISGLRQC